jgi:hypothetical protein
MSTDKLLENLPNARIKIIELPENERIVRITDYKEGDLLTNFGEWYNIGSYRNNIFARKRTIIGKPTGWFIFYKRCRFCRTRMHKVLEEKTTKLIDRNGKEYFNVKVEDTYTLICPHCGLHITAYGDNL